MTYRLIIIVTGHGHDGPFRIQQGYEQSHGAIGTCSHADCPVGLLGDETLVFGQCPFYGLYDISATVI